MRSLTAPLRGLDVGEPALRRHRRSGKAPRSSGGQQAHIREQRAIVERVREDENCPRATSVRRNTVSGAIARIAFASEAKMKASRVSV